MLLQAYSMSTMYKIFFFIKPILPVVIVVVGLQLAGQLGKVASYAQSAVLKTGVMNAGIEAEAEEDFDFNFTAFSPDGKPLLMDSLKNKVIFLNLWATWCGPCVAEMPTIQNLYNEIKNPNVVFVMLSIDIKNPEKKVKDYVKKNKYTFPVYILSGMPPEQLQVPSIPTTFVISKRGKIIRKEVGMANYDTEKFKKFLLREAAQ